MKFNKKIKTIFLDPNSSGTMPDERVNVILSPSLYWVKKLSLPVKNVRDAKKLLPSIFEDILPRGNYNYFIYQQGDVFFAFAYEDKMILDLLSEKGISDSNVKNVYFAQSELSFIDGTVTINKTQKICLKDGLIILLCDWVEKVEDVNLEDIKLSKNHIVLAQFGHIVDNNSLYTIGLILLMLVVLVTTEYLVTSHKIDKITDLKDKLFEKHNLQPTTLQNENILKKYLSIHSKQIKLREYTSIVLSLKLKAAEGIQGISFTNKTLSVKFNSLSDETIASILDNLKINGIKFKANKKVKSWNLEIVL